ncbi:MAG: hypothetical protein ABEH88_01790 [Halobacteriales archaeon]
MDINRRTVLLGLGAAGFGTTSLLVGSGAFSSVEAERTVAVNVTDDSDAVLSLEAVGDVGDEILDTESPNGGPAQIKLAQGDLNQHAKTIFEDALRVTNGSAQDVGFSVDESASDDPNDLIGNALDILKDGSTIVDSGSGNNAVDLNAGTSIDLTIVIDLLGPNAGSDISTINTIAIAAREEDYQ